MKLWNKFKWVHGVELTCTFLAESIWAPEHTCCVIKRPRLCSGCVQVVFIWNTSFLTNMQGSCMLMFSEKNSLTIHVKKTHDLKHTSLTRQDHVHRFKHTDILLPLLECPCMDSKPHLHFYIRRPHKLTLIRPTEKSWKWQNELC